MRLPFALLLIGMFATPASTDEIPRFQVDAGWPKPLPNDWIMGQAAGVAVDAQDHVWVIQRPAHAYRRREGANPYSAAIKVLPSCTAGHRV